MVLIVEKEFEVLENQRKAWLQAASELSEAQLTFRPAPDAWCILEVFVHLITAESNGLKYVNKKILGDLNKIEKAGLGSTLRAALLKFALRLPIKFKAPPAATFTPREHYNYGEIKEEWDNLRQGWFDFLDQLDKPTVNKPLFKHPMAGKINMQQALQFMYEHVEHHKKQVERIKANPDFPTA